MIRSTIRQIKDSQERYNQEIEALIQELERAHISDTPASTDPTSIGIGDRVTILNPSRFGSKEGTVVKITQTRVTVATTKGKVVRAHKN